MTQSTLFEQQYSREEQIPSHIDQLVRIESLLDKVAQEIGLPEERHPLFVVAVTEALSNAILHGNRQDPNKYVSLRFRYDPSRRVFSVEVEDQGPGFDPSILPDPTEADNLLRESGRGIFLMRNLADAVDFKKGGRCVELQFLL